MKKYCNLCGKKVRFMKKFLSHGQSRFHMCRCCFVKLSDLWNQEAYESAKDYLEEKMKRGSNERVNYIIRNKIQNADALKKQDHVEKEENSAAVIIQSTGILGGGILFLLGICMLNIHFEIAAALLFAAVILGLFLYGIGSIVSLIIHWMHRGE